MRALHYNPSRGASVLLGVDFLLIFLNLFTKTKNSKDSGVSTVCLKLILNTSFNKII